MADDIGKHDASITVKANPPVIPRTAVCSDNRGAGTDTIGGYSD